MLNSTYIALLLVVSTSLVGVSACGDDNASPGDIDAIDAADSGPGDPDASTDAADVDDTAQPGFALEVAWSSCSLFSEGSDMRAECADIEVPLHWDDRDGERITVFLKRYRGAEGGGQVWILPGGPGQSGSDVEPLVNQLITLDADRSYYMLDHRGVGRSTKLRCPSSEGIDGPNSIGLGEGEVAACLTEVRAEWTDEQLAGFSTTNAARDVGELIDHLRTGDELVSLYGGSYGTLWLDRYLSLYPEQSDAAVMSAVAIDVDLLSIDRYVDDVTRRWLDACDADTTCGPRFDDAFGRSAREVVTDAFSGADAALCPEIDALGLTIADLKPFFGQVFSDLQGRSFYAPIVYRLARCEPRDVAAITQLIAAFSPPDGPQDLPLTVRNWGFVLSEHIAINELSTERSQAEILADYNNAIAVQGTTPRLAESFAIWPRYDAPPFDNSAYQGALLMLHGEYDFLPTSAYQRTVDYYLDNNPNAEFKLIDGAPHSLESPTTTGVQCGGQLLVTRLLDPTAPLPDCVDDIVPLSFAPPAPVSMALFGTTDPWDGVPE